MINFSIKNNKNFSSKKPKTRFNKNQLFILNKWFINNENYPYPTFDEKLSLSKETGLDKVQLENWFKNKRRRINKKKSAVSKKYKNLKTQPKNLYLNFSEEELNNIISINSLIMFEKNNIQNDYFFSNNNNNNFSNNNFSNYYTNTIIGSTYSNNESSIFCSLDSLNC